MQIAFRIEIEIAALYLPGLPRPVRVARAQASAVISCLRRLATEHGSPNDDADILNREGFYEEASVLRSGECLAAAESAVRSGAVLTEMSPSYPSRWLRGPWPLVKTSSFRKAYVPVAIWIDRPPFGWPNLKPK